MCQKCSESVNGDQNLDEGKCCGARIVKVHKPWHICMAMQAFGQPGAGAYWNACCCHADHSQGLVFGNLIYAFLMAALSPCIWGWIASAQFGVGIYRKGK